MTTRWLCSLVAATTLVAAAGAQEQPVYEVPLLSRHVTVDLVNARVEAVVGEVEEGLLWFSAISEGVDAGSAVAVAGDGRVTRTAPEAAGERLLLELQLTAEQSLSVLGADLELSVLDRTAADRREAEASGAETAGSAPAEPQAGPVVEVHVEDSEVQLAGLVGSGAVAAAASHVSVDGCTGVYSFELEGGSARVFDHDGPLSLLGQGAEANLEATRGALSFEIVGGGVYTRDATGTVTGTATDATVHLDHHTGSADLSGRNTSLDLRECQGTLTVGGEELNLWIDGWNGAVNLTLRGGSVSGSVWRRAVTAVMTDGASLDADGLMGPVTLELERDTSATVRSVRNGLKATVAEAFLEAHEVNKLNVTARRGTVVASGVRTLERMVADASELELDLRSVRGKPRVQLGAGTNASIELTSPCLVKTEGAGAADNAIVTGCEHSMLRGRRRRPMLEGKLNVRLVVALSEEDSLTVSGSP
jgi:hypothetical protein